MLNKQKIYVDKLQGSNEQFFRVYQQTYTCVKLKIKTVYNDFSEHLPVPS